MRIAGYQRATVHRRNFPEQRSLPALSAHSTQSTTMLSSKSQTVSVSTNIKRCLLAPSASCLQPAVKPSAVPARQRAHAWTPTPLVEQPSRSVAAAAMRGSTGGKWWEKETPNMKSINSVQELVDELADAGDNLVIVDFYGQWCGACRALYPKLLKLMDQFPDVVFLKVDFDSNKAMCKTLGVKVLPYFHIYHGAEGRVAAFSCTTSKFQRMRDALEEYYTPICSLEQNPGLPEFPDIIPHPSEVTRVAGAYLPAAEEAMATAAAAATEPEPALVA